MFLMQFTGAGKPEPNKFITFEELIDLHLSESYSYTEQVEDEAPSLTRAKTPENYYKSYTDKEDKDVLKKLFPTPEQYNAKEFSDNDSNDQRSIIPYWLFPNVDTIQNLIPTWYSPSLGPIEDIVKTKKSSAAKLKYALYSFFYGEMFRENSAFDLWGNKPSFLYEKTSTEQAARIANNLCVAEQQQRREKQIADIDRTLHSTIEDFYQHFSRMPLNDNPEIRSNVISLAISIYNLQLSRGVKSAKQKMATLLINASRINNNPLAPFVYSIMCGVSLLDFILEPNVKPTLPIQQKYIKVLVNDNESGETDALFEFIKEQIMKIETIISKMSAQIISLLDVTKITIEEYSEINSSLNSNIQALKKMMQNEEDYKVIYIVAEIAMQEYCKYIHKTYATNSIHDKLTNLILAPDFLDPQSNLRYSMWQILFNKLQENENTDIFVAVENTIQEYRKTYSCKSHAFTPVLFLPKDRKNEEAQQTLGMQWHNPIALSPKPP